MSFLTTSFNFANPLDTFNYGIFGGISESPSFNYTAIRALIFSTESLVSTGNLSSGHGTTGTASSNSSGGVVSGNGGTEKYSKTTHTFSSGTALSTVIYYRNAIGDNSKGIFPGGLDSSNSYTSLSTSQKYTYSGDSVSSGGSLTAARNDFGGFSNQTFGLIYGGDGTSTSTNKYTYSTDVAASSATLGTSRYYMGGGMSNSTVGIVAGASSSTQRYTFSTETLSSGGTVTNHSISTGMGNSTEGFLWNDTNSTSQKYVYSSDTVSSSAVMPNVSYRNTFGLSPYQWGL